MSDPRTIENYGAPADGFVDAFPVEDPTCEQSAAYANRELEDQAQLTRTPDKAIVRFSTTTSVGAVAVTNGRSHYGTGPTQHPTIARVSAGRYTITYATSYLDALGTSETVTFYTAKGHVESLSTAGNVQGTVASNVINVAVFDMAGVLSDLGGSIPICIEAK